MSQKKILEKVKPLMAKHGARFRKKTNVLAKPAKGGEVIETVTNDGKETTNTASPGSMLVRNQTEAGEMYIMEQESFHRKYQYLRPHVEGYAEYRSTGEIEALELTRVVLDALSVESPFYFEASWGEETVAKEGDYLVIPKGGKEEVYRIARREFGETYEAVPA